MAKNLVVKNHVYCLGNEINKYDKVYYCPSYNSPVQESFFKKQYDEITKVYPKVKWQCENETLENSYVLSWDAFFENKIDNNLKVPVRNRLFENVPFDIPDTFTAFRKKAEALLPEYYDNACSPFTSSVKNEIKYYFVDKKLASSYFETRNGLIGRDYSTQFSPYLSNGLLDVKYLYNEVKKFELKNSANKSTYWIVFELLWRDFFFHHYQKWQTMYFSENGLKGSKKFIAFKEYSIEELKNISPNRFFSAALNELEITGFLSNRVRQIFASIWLNDLNLNWRSGANLFERYFIDYDVFSNYGNWMYLAGVGVDPRGKRYFKLAKQLDKYDPEREYEKKWLAID